MSFFKRILEKETDAIIQDMDNCYKSEREFLMGELCQHLRQIDVNATLLEPDSPEAFRYTLYVLGCVKIKGRNLDVILMQEAALPGPSLGRGRFYNYNYVVRTNVDDLEGKLRVDFKSDWQDRCCLMKDFKWADKASIAQVSGSRWKGGELAQLLNADSDLTCTLYSEGLDRLEIRPDRDHGCVRVTHPHNWKFYSKGDMGPGDYEWTYMSDEGTPQRGFTVGRKQFPSREAFEAYDRIAYTIRRFIKLGSSTNK